MSVICRLSGQAFTVSDAHRAFLAKMAPEIQGKKYAIPLPTLHPQERKRRRMVWRNENKLYPDICDLTGKPIISVFSPDKPFQVYSEPAWWSDEWDALNYGRPYDFNRSFFSQYRELMLAVPQPALVTDFLPNINSEYINLAGASKNCYLIFDTGDCEGCLYGHSLYRDIECVDCDYTHDSSYCYDCVYCQNCYEVQTAVMCRNTSNSQYVFNVRSCKNCFLSHNLDQKEYYILNKPYTRETYHAEVEKLKAIIPDLKAFFLEKIVGDTTIPRKYYVGNNIENTSGNYINNVKNCEEVFNAAKLEDCSYVRIFEDAKDCFDCDMWGWNTELNYECQETGSGAHNIAFCSFCWDNVSELYYSQFCRWSNHLFGCFGLRRKEYCILNKQYSKQEYEELVPRIITHMIANKEWGEFFPMHISHFGYNETAAQEYLPLTKVEALQLGATWCDYQSPLPQASNVVPAATLPKHISEVNDDILQAVILAEGSDRPFKITKQELAFYRKYNLPLPHYTPDERHQKRMTLRLPEQLWDRNCQRCQQAIKTSYAPQRPEQIYCEECYASTM